MDKKTIMDTVERYKAKAKIFLDSGEQAFVKNYANDLFFCTVKKVENNFMIVHCFAGHRKNTTPKIYFIDIERFDEYEEMGGRE